MCKFTFKFSAGTVVAIGAFLNLFLFWYQKTLYFFRQPWLSEWELSSPSHILRLTHSLTHFAVLLYFSFFSISLAFFFSVLTLTPQVSKIIRADIPLFSSVSFPSVWYVYSNSFKHCCISASSSSSCKPHLLPSGRLNLFSLFIQLHNWQSWT